MIIGTAAYLAPEQVAGGTSDARTDVYAAGIMLFELLTGIQPHAGESPLAIAYKHVDEVVPPPSSVLPGLPGAVDALVAMATSRDPDLRPVNAGQFLRAIQEVKDAQPRGAAPSQAPAGYGPAASFQGSEPHPSLPLHSGSWPVMTPGPDGASYPYPIAGRDYEPGEFDPGDYDPGDYEPGGYQTPRHWESPHAGDATPGPVGASALPSLSPQRSEVPPASSADPRSMANNTLVVADATDIDVYRDLPGAGYRQPADGVRYRGRRAPGQSWLSRFLLTGRLMYVPGALALALVIALVTWWFSSGRYEPVPALRGMTLSAAKTVLTNQGLTYRLAPSLHNPLPKGEVIKVSPGSGQQISGGSPVTLTLSLGPVILQVPDVSGKSEADAMAYLKEQHLRVGQDKPAVSSTVPAGAVIGTIPRAYTKIPQTRPVRLIVSQGPGLPSFVGMQVTDAQTAAAAGGYQINAVANAKGDQPANTIISQSPPPNTPITPGEVVTVHFSPGPPMIPVPDVTGMPVRQAIDTLHQAGFRIAVNHAGPGGTVGNYDPQGDQPQGTVITLTIGILSGL
jgi:serine/threonine-protein kinase